MKATHIWKKAMGAALSAAREQRWKVIKYGDKVTSLGISYTVVCVIYPGESIRAQSDRIVDRSAGKVFRSLELAKIKDDADEFMVLILRHDGMLHCARMDSLDLVQSN